MNLNEAKKEFTFSDYYKKNFIDISCNFKRAASPSTHLRQRTYELHGKGCVIIPSISVIFNLIWFEMNVIKNKNAGEVVKGGGEEESLSESSI